jgi:hypothetical protein
MSLYYTVSRSHPLSPGEEQAVSAAIARYPRQHERWEDFCRYAPPFDAADTIFEGATGIPMYSQNACWEAIQYWCALLTEIRRVLPGSNWEVSLDDHEIRWDPAAQEFDPSQ